MSARRNPRHSGLEIGGAVYTYGEMLERATSLAATLQAISGEDGTYTGVLGGRTVVTYTGIIAALLRGHAYVPLNPRFPAQRIRTLIERAHITEVVVDSEGERTLLEVIRPLPARVKVILPHRDSTADLTSAAPQHQFLGGGSMHSATGYRTASVDFDQPAYLLFTSGSTGAPKGVPVTHRNIANLFRGMGTLFGFQNTDRFSQFADLSFDASVFDLFAAWNAGATLCVPDSRDLLNPARFLSSNGITVFKSVPSNLRIMDRIGALKPGRFPEIRTSLFGGEALPSSLCAKWQAAAPNSLVANVYGPTEAAIDATVYFWDPARSPSACIDGIVPIGKPLPTVQCLVVDDQLRELSDGEKGELLLGGPQVCPGYLADPERTGKAMIRLANRPGIFYRTGDVVTRQPASSIYCYHGRVDFQIKILGMRIEPGEIEAAIRNACDETEVAVIGWPITPFGATGIVAFIGGGSVDPAKIKDLLRETLPQQMVPRDIRVLDRLPLNVNGKIDRVALCNYLRRAQCSPCSNEARS